MSNFLTRGLRQRQVHGGLDWRERMTDTIRDEWPTPMASERTLVAERGLGVTGKPYYFYVLRAVESFGLVVFVMAESEEVGWPEDARGATPFDSGGLWWRKFAADPPLDEAGRRMYFERHDVPLASWRAAFERYVRKRHTSVADYVKGNAPKAGSEPTPNDSRAWTWEVRVPHALVAGRFKLQAACMMEADRANYLDWLWRHSALAESESIKVQRWVDDNALVPKGDESVVQIAQDWIVDNV